MAGEIGIALVGTGLGLGLRHGVDWDHIAAISDVTASQDSRLRSIVMGTLYAVGHAIVVVILGMFAIWAGSTLPESLDPYMDAIVGITLIILGAWILFSLVRNRGRLVFRSRWMLLADAARNGYGKLARRLRRRQPENAEAEEGAGTGRSSYGVASSTTVGVIHGIGAETGTQALLLASAAGASSAAAGSFLLVFFSIGLIASNFLITLGATFGWISSTSRRVVQTTLGLLIAGFSLAIGFIFLFQQGDILPGFFA